MGFRVVKSTGKEDKVKTNRLKRQLRKSCDKITKTITEEVRKFQEMAKAEQLEEAFWMHAAHRAMLYIDAKSEDSFLAGDLWIESLSNETLIELLEELEAEGAAR